MQQACRIPSVSRRHLTSGTLAGARGRRLRPISATLSPYPITKMKSIRALIHPKSTALRPIALDGASVPFDFRARRDPACCSGPCGIGRKPRRLLDVAERALGVRSAAPDAPAGIGARPAVIAVTTRNAVNGARSKPWFGTQRANQASNVRIEMSPPADGALSAVGFERLAHQEGRSHSRLANISPPMSAAAVTC